jgi:hypothetical protein
MKPCCLFCLEPIETSSIQNPIGCACRVTAHQPCFDQWIQRKNQMECPICHTVSIPNRSSHEAIHIVYVNSSAENLRQERSRGHDKAAAFCCCLLLGWAIGITVLDLAFQKY